MPDSFETPVLFLDFDGTISRADVVDAILERLAEPGWQRLEDDWRAGRIGSRGCLAGQMAFVRAAEAAMNGVIDSIGLDAGFARLLELARRRALPVFILSDGFDYCIERFLGRLAEDHGRLLAGRVYASHLEPAAGGQWRTGFPYFEQPCEHGCATCKPALMRHLNVPGAPTIFVGDGLSDRYAALAADLVFAKGSLAAECEHNGATYIAYRDLADVAAIVEDGMRAGRAWRADAAHGREASGAGAA